MTKPDLSQHAFGIRRDGNALVSFEPSVRVRWSKHAKIDHSQAHLPARYLALRDAMPGNRSVMDAMRKHVPRAAQIVEIGRAHV